MQNRAGTSEKVGSTKYLSKIESNKSIAIAKIFDGFFDLWFSDRIFLIEEISFFPIIKSLKVFKNCAGTSNEHDINSLPESLSTSVPETSELGFDSGRQQKPRKQTKQDLSRRHRARGRKRIEELARPKTRAFLVECHLQAARLQSRNRMTAASYTPAFLGFYKGDDDESILENPLIKETQQKILAFRKQRCKTAYLSTREKVKSFCVQIDLDRKRRQLQEIPSFVLEQARSTNIHWNTDVWYIAPFRSLSSSPSLVEKWINLFHLFIHTFAKFYLYFLCH